MTQINQEYPETYLETDDGLSAVRQALQRPFRLHWNSHHLPDVCPGAWLAVRTSPGDFRLELKIPRMIAQQAPFFQFLTADDLRELRLEMTGGDVYLQDCKLIEYRDRLSRFSVETDVREKMDIFKVLIWAKSGRLARKVQHVPTLEFVTVDLVLPETKTQESVQ